MNIFAVSLACMMTTATPTHQFSLGPNDFLLDGKPFVIESGEMHPARIPAEYWRHRIQMTKALGLNTVAAYVFWNYHETSPGRFNFRSGNHNIAEFIRIAQQEGMWVILRPGPYVCAEWDFGGIPSYLLKNLDLKVRCMNPQYMAAASRYICALAKEVAPLQVSKGGPILMVQVENEYGSYGNDRTYLHALEKLWRDAGIDVPFYTADGPTSYMLEAGSLPGAAVGLDSGGSEDNWTLAKKINPGVPVFSSETYPGWLTHWGENWARVGAEDAANEVSWLTDHRKSFNLYVVHGGTNFGLTAGANSGGHGYEPDITSYDYDAPISEQGRATEKYLRIREVLGKSRQLPAIPAPIPTTSFGPVSMVASSSVWDTLPAPKHIAQPKSFEELGQNQGLVLYRTQLVGHHSGSLRLTELHDYATVFVDGKYVGKIDRRLGEKGLTIPEGKTLDLLVEGMGHINFAQEMIDRKGITERVTLNGMTLMNWDVFLLPLGDLKRAPVSQASVDSRPGRYFSGQFSVDQVADTFVDLTGYEKGYVWVNGHLLGRYWNIGPQTRLYCPASWLRKGANDLVVLDLHQLEAKPISGFAEPQ